MATYQPRDLPLQEVVELIGDGRMRLPEFQRNFTWALSDQRSLLDSIQKQYPVGTLLLLDVVGRSGGSPFGERSFTGAPSLLPKATELLVLDGQQRLSTCYRALSPKADPMFCIDLAKLFARTGGKPRQPIDLADMIVPRKRPVHIQNLLYNKNLLPFEFLTDRDGLRERLAQYRVNLAKRPETEAFGKFVEIYLEGYVDIFFDYRFPAVVLPGSLDIEAVANVFTKINTTGLKLSAFDLCVASLFPKGVKLRELFDLARDTHDEVESLDRDGTNLLQAVALLANTQTKKAALVKNITKGHVDGHWNDAVDGLTRAGKVLEEVGAPNWTLVPYDAMVPVLAAALARTPIPKNPPQRDELRRKVARWIQQTAFLQTYNEGTDVKQVNHFPEVVAWLAGASEPAFLADNVIWQPTWAFLPRNGARPKAILAMLNGIGPRDLLTPATRLGKGVPHRETGQLHHIFPRAYLRQQGYEKEQIEVALNITFLTADSNNFISDRAPSAYLEDRIQHLQGGNVTREMAIAQVKDVLSDHLVDGEAWDALLRDDYDAFLVARGKVVQSHLKGWGIPVVVAQEDSEAEQEEAAFVEDSAHDEEPVEV